MENWKNFKDGLRAERFRGPCSIPTFSPGKRRVGIYLPDYILPYLAIQP